ncbi:hypothetical protein [Actinoplanes sp. HUAS TT8]|uniref:hypothetical protein n=1 Tax=Actinoplanes sp. HUAS TT8 TaxID=3447453 RepID=UPI003F525943
MGSSNGLHALTAAQVQRLALARLSCATRPWSTSTRPAARAPADLEPAVAALIGGRTSIVVAHRLSRASACDQIVVILVLWAGITYDVSTRPRPAAPGWRRCGCPSISTSGRHQ